MCRRAISRPQLQQNPVSLGIRPTSMRRYLNLLTVLMIAPPALAAQASSSASRGTPEIVVNGTGSVRLKSDRANVTIAVVTRASSAATAGRQNALQFQPVLAALKRQGLVDSALTTTGYSVTLEPDAYGRAPSTAASARQYVARNAVGVTLTNLDLLGQVLDTALAAGATEVANITFTSSQVDVSRERAIALAVRSAYMDAAAIAAAARGTLGPVVEVVLLEEYGRSYGASVAVSESGNYAGAGTQLRARDVNVTVSVRVRYAFVPPN